MTPVPATAAASEFSAQRAMEHVGAIAQRPRPSGSAEHARVRQYLIDPRAIGLAEQTRAQDLAARLASNVNPRFGEAVAAWH